MTPHIEVLGFDCPACRKTFRLVEEVAQGLGIDVSLEKVDDPERLAAHRVLSVPAVVINGRLLHSGSSPSRKAIANWLTSIAQEPYSD